MWLKRCIAALLCCLLLLAALPLSAVAVAEEEKDLMDNYVIYQIYDKHELKSTSSGYGYGWTKDLKINLSDVAPENLALSMRFYVENEDDPGNISTLLNAPSNDLKLSTEEHGATRLLWKMNAIKTADGSDLKAGWNDILLPFTSADGYNGFDFSQDIITFFWIQFSNMELPVATHTVRMQEVAIVDTSRPAEKEETTDWDTTYLVGEIPFAMGVTINGNGSSTSTAVTQKAFAPIDASKHDPKKLQLVMDIEVENVTNPGDVSVLSQISGQIELTSSGKNDSFELSGGVQALNWRDGQNEYAISLSTFTNGSNDGAIDFSNINFMRIYMNNWPAEFTDTIKVKVTNVRLVDITNAATLPTLFGNGMVFQQNKPMNLWGYGKEGDAITAKLYKGEELLDTKETTIPASKRWELAFSAREGSYDAYTIVIEAGDQTPITIEDVLVGEVWIGSGQSNMALSVSTDMNAADIIADANNPYVRMYIEPTFPLGREGEQPVDPAEDVPGAFWGYGDNGAQVAKASAVGYTFVKNLQEALDVPVALIDASTGGTVIEAWLPRTAIEEDAAVKKALQARGLYYDAEWWPTSAGSMSTLYNQKIGPLEGMNIAGVIWYQGESNSNRSEIYDIELDLLKRSWGEAFGFENGDMPLIFTQVAPYLYDYGTQNQQHLGYLAMYMERGWALSADKNTAMITIYDLPLDHMKDGASSDPIHPRIKTPVGERFFLSAMNMVYGGEEEYTAPVYKSMEIKDSAIYVTFDRVGSMGLLSNDLVNGYVHGFTIAGEDGVYVNAQAQIVDEDTVMVWNNRVSDPKNVTYAFDNFNQAADLYNSSLIPASPFRTAQVDDTTMKPALRYFTAQDWMLCDKDVWVYDTNHPENPAVRNTGYRPSFTVSEGASYTYDPLIMAEGLGSLRVAHTASATVSPVLSYESIKQEWTSYKYLSVKLLNADTADKTVALQIVSGGKTYTAPTVDGEMAATAAANADRFALVTFDLTKLTDADGNQPANPTAVLKNMTALNFVVTAEGDGTLFFDAVSIGMTDTVTPESELNEAEEPALMTSEDVQTVLGFVDAFIDESLFTAESVADYKAARAALETLMADETATKLQLTDATTAMLLAMEKLEAIEVDTSALEEAIANAITDLSPYTEESAAAYTEALENAITVLEEMFFATQEDVDGAVALLKEAEAALVKKAEDIPPEKLLGDVNGDGEVNTTDARLVLQYAVEKIDETALDLSVADVNRSEKVDTTDARLILQKAVDKIEDFG